MKRAQSLNYLSHSEVVLLAECVGPLLSWECLDRSLARSIVLLFICSIGGGGDSDSTCRQSQYGRLPPLDPPSFLPGLDLRTGENKRFDRFGFRT